MNRPVRQRARPSHPGSVALLSSTTSSGGSAIIGKNKRGARRRPPPPAAINFFFGRGEQNAAAADDNDKHVIFVRHGTTEMNEYLHTQCNYYSPDFKDPLIFDTRLTRDGERRAKEAASQARRLQPRPELIVASPLTRALQTAELAFGPLLDEGIPCLALPLARERLFLSSDVGRPGAELAAEFPRWEESLLALGDEWWLHRRRPVGGGSGDGGRDCGSSSSSNSEDDDGGVAAGAAAATATATAAARRSTRRRRLRTPTPKPNPAVEEEGDDDFAARMDCLGEWLALRPERCVAIVSHWGVILEATGHEFENVEMRAFRRSQLRL